MKKKLPKLGKLQKQCDTLMQQVGKRLYPKSIISGLPTEVMHHLVEKSISARLRYDWDNLIPLTNAEHCRLHQSGDLWIPTQIIKKKGGLEWYEALRKRGRERIKVNREYYEKQMEKLKDTEQKCKHQFELSQIAISSGMATIGTVSFYRTVAYVICVKCGLVKQQDI